MATRRHSDSSSDAGGSGDSAAVDSWASFTANAPGADDFWGDLPDWSGRASTTRRTTSTRIGGATHAGDERGRDGESRDDRETERSTDPTAIDSGPPRPGLLDGLKGAWGGLLGGGTRATRSHRRGDMEQPIGDLPARVEHDPQPIDDPSLSDPGALDAPRGSERSDVEGIERRWIAQASQAGNSERSDVEGIERRWIAQASQAGNSERSPIDPLLVRIGAIVIVASLLVPLLFAVTGTGDETDDSFASEPTASEPSVQRPKTLGVDDAAGADPAPSTSSSASTGEPSDDEGLASTVDPASLPPAVPVERPDAAPGAASRSDVGDAQVAGQRAESVGSVAVGSAASSDSVVTSESVDDVSAPAAVEQPASRVEPPVCPVPYTVIAGDFWLRLADGAGVDLDALLDVNGASQDTPLFPGSEICLPEGASVPPPPTTAPPTTTGPPATTVAPTTTPPTTVAPTTLPPATAPAAEPPGPDDIKQIIRDVWPDELEARALEVAYRESRFVPTAQNFCCYGLFQIYWEVHDVWLVDLGITSSSQLFDPETNARAALALYERAGGWGPWEF